MPFESFAKFNTIKQYYEAAVNNPSILSTVLRMRGSTLGRGTLQSCILSTGCTEAGGHQRNSFFC